MEIYSLYLHNTQAETYMYRHTHTTETNAHIIHIPWSESDTRQQAKEYRQNILTFIRVLVFVFVFCTSTIYFNVFSGHSTVYAHVHDVYTYRYVLKRAAVQI